MPAPILAAKFTMVSPELPRWLKIRMRLGRKRYNDYFSTNVLRIGFGQIVKLRCNPVEVEAMEYIRQHTSIPVPKVIKIYSYIYEGDDFQDVIMQYIDGESLDVAWHNMTKASKQDLSKELAEYVDQMRQLTPPKEGFVGSVSLGTGYDHRFGKDRFGPFSSIRDFHTYVLRHDPLEAWKEEKEVIQVHTKSNSYASKFTHGDLVPSNIIVKNGKINAIVDWETAGWYPEYWEYTKIHYQWRPYHEEFYREMDRTMVTYPTELAAEQAIWKRYAWYAYELRSKRTK